MAPTNTKSFRQIKSFLKELEFDPEKGMVRLPVEFGYKVIFAIEPHVSLNPYDPFQNNAPEIQSNIMLRPIKIEGGPDAIPQSKVREILQKRDVIPEEMSFQDMTIGFTYATPDNPQNHKWMLEFRRNKKIFWALHFLGVSVNKVPIQTTSWFDNIFHGRFLVSKQDIGKTVEVKPGFVELQGKDMKRKIPKGDTSLIPAGVDRIRLRFNIKEDFWYGDLLAPKEIISKLKPLKFKNITAENMFFEGIADYTFQKPKVYYIAKVKDIANIMVMANNLIIQGLG